jgi:hypothetical protein
MKLTTNQVIALGSILKSAQETEAKPSKAGPPPHGMVHIPSEAYPSYSRALITQYKAKPRRAGIIRGVETGVLGAILAALAARMVSDNPAVVGGAAGLGGLAGALPGYQSGKQEALSDYSRLLFLRRLGITRPGELEALLKFPAMSERVSAQGANV